MRTKKIVGVLGMLAVIAAALIPLRASAQLAAGITAEQLFVDPKSGQVFIRPARGRVPLKIQGVTSADIEQQVTQKVDEKVRASEIRREASNAELQASNATLQKQVSAMQPAWKSYATSFGSRIKIGTLWYADWGMYTHTGWGPQFAENLNPPGPGNNFYNSFDITRAYINLLFTPMDDWTLRVTPDIYRTIGSSNQKFGTNQSLGSNLNGNLGYRLKYTYLRYGAALKSWQAAKSDTITFGTQPNPLIDWEEQLFGYRYVTLVPWNYIGLSASHTGLSIQGPINFNEKQYLDYDAGVYDNGSFRTTEAANTKEAMIRTSFYPFGAKWRFDGLGLTGFFNYGYGNTTPDAAQLPTTSKGPNSAIYRMAALLHYTTEQMGVAFEYDLGKNAFSSGNFFSASGPPQQFGTTPAPPAYAGFNTMVNGILNSGQAREEGFDFFGHYHFPDTPFTVFGLFQWFLPNTKVSKNPIDFERYAVGVSYQYNEFLRFALDSQALMFYHQQFTFPDGQVTGVDSDTPFAVPRDTHALFLNLEFNY